MPILAAEPDCFPADLLGGPFEGTFGPGHEVAVGDESASARAWAVMHTKPRQEKSLARELFVREIPFYLPQVPKTSVVRGRKQTAYVPLFTSYVFVYANDFERHASMTTNRIAQIIRVANPEELFQELRSLSRLVTSGAPLTVESRLKAGDWVRVKSGALVGVEGTVVARRRKCRLIVAVSLLQQGVSVEIDDHLLEPI
ncbi:MAG: transcription termination/antitermination protein NusG [Pirellulales bacterium]